MLLEKRSCLRHSPKQRITIGTSSPSGLYHRAVAAVAFLFWDRRYLQTKITRSSFATRRDQLWKCDVGWMASNVAKLGGDEIDPWSVGGYGVSKTF